MAGCIVTGLQEDFSADFLRQPLATLRLLHYSAAAAKNRCPVKQGCGAEHTDFGGITITFCWMTNPGLQVWDRR